MQKFPLTSLLSLLALTSAKSILKIPDDWLPSNRQQPRWLHEQDNLQQQPITHPVPIIPQPSDHHTATLEIEAWSLFAQAVYTTPIAVGIPNQPFRAWLDFGFDGLLVRSVDCTDDCGYGGDLGLFYNSSASKSYQDGKERFELPLPAHRAYGSVARDEVHLVDFGLENVTFGAIEQFYGENYFLMILSDLADGALGLAPPNATADLPYTTRPCPNILSHLMSQAPLAKKLVSFTLPTNLYTGVKGSIALGALPSGHSDIDVDIPMGDLSKGWNAPLSSLTLDAVEGSGDKDVEISLDEDTALIPSLSAGALNLPSKLTEKLYPALHALPDEGWLDGRDFNCSFRGLLPNLTFVFPSSTTSPLSHNGGSETVSISLAERDYTLHGYAGEEEICLLTILPHEAEDERGMERVVEIGTPLWQGWHVVFDLEEEGKERLGLIEREREDDGEEGMRVTGREVDFAERRKMGKRRGWN